jgi:hydrogenase maturation factor
MAKPPEKRLKSGKLPVDLLGRLLKRYAPGGRGLVVGPSVGIDSAVIDFHGRYLLAKTDPITFVAEGIGTYALHINANDIAVMGGTPRWFLATILLPEKKATVKIVKTIFKDLHEACKATQVVLAGGHTEVTPGIDIPIVVGQMLGEVEKKRLVTAGGAKAGDDVILTKGIAIEATSVLARAMGPELITVKSFPKSFIARCTDFLKKPGISVMKDAELLLKWARTSAMHDPTEGGLATGLHELAIASGCGLMVDRAEIRVYPETASLCAHFGLDPMGAIASGALIAAVDPADTKRAIKKLSAAGIPASRIGTITAKRAGVRLRDGKSVRPLKLFERDELTRVL